MTGESERPGEHIDWQAVENTSSDVLLDHHYSRMSWGCWSKYIPQNSSVLEIGCGTGRVIVQAGAYKQARGVGLDISPSALRAARNLAGYLQPEQVAFVQASGFAVPFNDNTFDAVVSDGVIEHFSISDTEAMVHEHVRVCKPGGRVIISVPNVLNLPRTYTVTRLGSSYMAYPERGYTIWGLASLFRRCGLKPIARDGYAPCISLEWFVHPRLKLHAVDRLIARSARVSSLLGYLCLAVGVK